MSNGKEIHNDARGERIPLSNDFKKDADVVWPVQRGDGKQQEARIDYQSIIMNFWPKWQTTLPEEVISALNYAAAKQSVRYCGHEAPIGKPCPVCLRSPESGEGTK